MDMNPFAVFSKKGISLYEKFKNNLLVYDPSLESKDKLRWAHVAEISNLLSKAIGVFGHDEIAYWDFERDGSLRKYELETSGEK